MAGRPNRRARLAAEELEKKMQKEREEAGFKEAKKAESEEVEKAEGEVLPPSTKKPQIIIEQEEVRERLKRTPEAQYEYMLTRYLENTDANAFLSMGEVNDIVRANTFIRTSTYKVPIRKFLTPAELQGACDAYFILMHRNAEQGGDAIPDVEQLALFLGTSRNTFLGWRKDENLEQVIDDAMNRIAVIKKQLAMKNKIPALIYLSDIQNNHGYHDRKSVEIDIAPTRRVTDRQALIESAKMLP